MGTLPKEDLVKIQNMTYAVLKSELDRTYPNANPVWRLGILEEIHRRDVLRDAEHQKVQTDIRRITRWTLAVGIIVLIVTLFQLFK